LRSDLSVVICTHNPHAGNLRRTLNALREQTLPFEKWELLLIDNASAEPLASSWDLSWHPHARHIAEPQLGLSAARHHRPDYVRARCFGSPQTTRKKAARDCRRLARPADPPRMTIVEFQAVEQRCWRLATTQLMAAIASPRVGFVQTISYLYRMPLLS
jgi:hypothetical protein